MFEKSFKILKFDSNGMQLKFTVWFTVYCWKTKNIAKNQIFAKIASLGIINNVSPSSQKNQRILEKLSLKTFFGPKLGLHCPPWVKVSLTNSHIAYNWTIHLYFLDVRFQLLCLPFAILARRNH